MVYYVAVDPLTDPCINLRGWLIQKTNENQDFIDFGEVLLDAHDNLITIMVAYDKRFRERSQTTTEDQDNVIDLRQQVWERTVRDDVAQLHKAVEELVQIVCA